MESTEWYLNNSKYIGRIDENDVLALIVATVMTILDNKGYPERFSDMNRRGAPDTWKIGMLVVRQFLKCSYEMGSEFFGSMKGVLELGGLAAPPHKSTLRKFSYRISKELIDELIFETAHLASLPTVKVAVDGTGFIDTNASPHYLKKAHLMSKSAPADGGKEGLTYCCTAVRGFPKATLAGDVDSLSVYVCDTVTDHSADVTRICPVVDTMDGFGLGVDLVLADKGYDAEYVHVHINEKLKCATVIPARDREPARLGDPKKVCTRGFHRKKMKTEWAVYYPDYRYRGLIECINSIIKRLFGGNVKSRTNRNRKFEIALKCLAHNLWRLKKLNLLAFARGVVS